MLGLCVFIIKDNKSILGRLLKNNACINKSFFEKFDKIYIFWLRNAAFMTKFIANIRKLDKMHEK